MCKMISQELLLRIVTSLIPGVNNYLTEAEDRVDMMVTH